MVRRFYISVIQVVKWLPIIVHVIIIFNIFDICLFGESYTGYLYPVIGHSLVFDVMMFYLSYTFNMCAWHRVLVINMVFNSVLDWLAVNVVSSDYIYDLMVVSAIFTTLSIVISISLVFGYRFGRKRNEGKNRH